MKKQISFSFISTICLFVLSFILFSCDTLRKSPAPTAQKRKPPTTANRRPATPAGRRPATAARTAPAKPTYTRPAGNYSKEIPQVVEVARTYSGTPYRSGGNDKNGIDCSGLICSVYSEIGIKVPRISWQQSEFGTEVGSIEEIRAGDWLFFVPEAGKEGYVSHAGIVTDVRNQDEIFFIHASTSRGVREDNLFSTYFKGRFVKAMRPF
ncbi:Cell wall-associated hydrolase, NlpC family [Dyadobacter koreensis]|uniref:Cell wall-associated hydrolase, NlpC family n=1 Tax=Dyadobacter koreensis TaxID=408657 RepID=A0A1H6Z0T4_9BACT|nr:C40 family peptidase [Dyadobacter koreensis]SEJ47038.1 Cell wall-associated hydrolase, NlpC family [Dyadobacter koreensis]